MIILQIKVAILFERVVQIPPKESIFFCRPLLGYNLSGVVYDL